MSREMRQLIKESNLIEGIKDPKEIGQSLIAWEYLLDHNFSLKHGTIQKVQKIITLNQPDLQPNERGYYRDMNRVNVRVGSYYPPDYGFVSGLMSNWLLDYGDMTPWEAHKRFEAIHPFVDGNGRTGRMIMWWDEVKRGQEPTMIKAAERQKYYKALASKDAGHGADTPLPDTAPAPKKSDSAKGVL